MVWLQFVNQGKSKHRLENCAQRSYFLPIMVCMKDHKLISSSHSCTARDHKIISSSYSCTARDHKLISSSHSCTARDHKINIAAFHAQSNAATQIALMQQGMPRVSTKLSFQFHAQPEGSCSIIMTVSPGFALPPSITAANTPSLGMTQSPACLLIAQSA